MEIEYRAYLKDTEELKKELKNIKAKLKSQEHIIDYWFCEKEKNKFNQVKQNSPGSYGLRIRRKILKKEEIIELNCKVIKEDGDHNAFYENEIKVDSLKSARNILDSIGFKVFCIVDKKRTTYSFENCLINIDEIVGFKPAIELEIISDENIEEHKKYLLEILSILKIEKDNFIKKSITHDFMEGNAFKQKITI